MNYTRMFQLRNAEHDAIGYLKQCLENGDPHAFLAHLAFAFDAHALVEQQKQEGIAMIAGALAQTAEEPDLYLQPKAANA